MVVLGGSVDLHGDPMGLVLHRPDPTVGPQGYRLQIGTDALNPRVTIGVRDDSGLTSAQSTLGQLLRQYGHRLPRLVIEDGPALAVRGVMLDVSRDRVPTMQRLFETASMLSGLKVNHLQLYTEHTFAYTGHEAVWAGCSPITPEEMRRLVERCAEVGIDLAANQNCFGHLERWLTHAAYADLAETHGEYDFYGLMRRGPHSLCPVDGRSLELVRGWLDELLGCTRSRWVNIGCDETADVGWGRSRGAVAERGALSVYLEHVRRVVSLVEARGRRAMFWADVALRHPERVPEIPKDLLSLVWGYEPQSPMGAWCHTLASAGREFWVCPGTSSWRSITGRTRERRGNLESAARAAAAHGADGWLACDWGDLGHRQQAVVSDVAIAEAAAMAWNPRATPDERAISLHVLGDRTLRAAGWLARLGDADTEIRAIAGRRSDPSHAAPLTNASALFEHLHPCGYPTHLPTEARAWEEVADRLAALEAERPRVTNALIDDEMAHTVAVARFAAMHAAWERRGRAEGSARRDLRDRLEAIIQTHRRLWLARSREGGLSRSVGWYEGLRRRV